MLYLIVAIINCVYGILLLTTLDNQMPGFYLVVFISSVLTILGFVGLVLWFYKTLIAPKSSDQSTALKNWFQIAKGVDILLILGLLFRSFILQPFLVEGSSMEPNFHNREFLLVDRISYKFNQPQRGQVIIFKFPKNPSEDYIKRIIGVPGDNIKVEAGQVYVNGNIISQDFLPDGAQTNVSSSRSNSLELTLNQNEFFVMGDNRDNSSDSREWGIVPQANLIGRAWFIVYPFNYFGLVKTPQLLLNTFTYANNLS